MKKFTAIILSIIMAFSLAAMPVSAATADSNIAVVSEDDNIIGNIIEIFHNIIAGLFEFFGLDCPFCDGHGETSVAMSEQEIVDKYNTAVNNLKNYQKSVKMEKKSTIDLEVTDCPGGDSVRMIVEEVLESFNGTVTDEENYILGQNRNGKLSNKVPPSEKDASLTLSAVKNITLSEKNGKQIIRVQLKDGKGYFDGTTMVDPEGYADVLNTLNFGTLDMGPVNIEDADITYSGVVVEAVLDSEGRVESLETVMPLAFVATARITVIYATLGIEGNIKEVYKFAY